MQARFKLITQEQTEYFICSPSQANSVFDFGILLQHSVKFGAWMKNLHYYSCWWCIAMNSTQLNSRCWFFVYFLWKLCPCNQETWSRNGFCSRCLAVSCSHVCRGRQRCNPGFSDPVRVRTLVLSWELCPATPPDIDLHIFKTFSFGTLFGL